MLIDSSELVKKDASVSPLSIYIPLFPRIPEPLAPIKTERGQYTPKNSLNNLSGKDWIIFTRSWFEHHPPPRNKKTGETLHPAKFPEDLIANFIKFFTKEGMWVLDPFAGTGSTLVACDMTRRNGIGIELSEIWANIAANRSKQHLIHGDCRNILKYNLPTIDFCISSPPYWYMLGHSRGGSSSTQKKRIKAGFEAKFSEDPFDMGNIPLYDDFMKDLMQLYKEILQITTPGKYCAVIIQNQLKENQTFFPLAWEFAFKMRDIGWQMCQEFIWCARDRKLNIWGYPSSYISNVHHHYILIFRKPSK